MNTENFLKSDLELYLDFLMKRPFVVVKEFRYFNYFKESDFIDSLSNFNGFDKNNIDYYKGFFKMYKFYIFNLYNLIDFLDKNIDVELWRSLDRFEYLENLILSFWIQNNKNI